MEKTLVEFKKLAKEQSEKDKSFDIKKMTWSTQKSTYRVSRIKASKEKLEKSRNEMIELIKPHFDDFTELPNKIGNQPFTEPLTYKDLINITFQYQDETTYKLHQGTNENGKIKAAQEMEQLYNNLVQRLEKNEKEDQGLKVIEKQEQFDSLIKQHASLALKDNLTKQLESTKQSLNDLVNYVYSDVNELWDILKKNIKEIKTYPALEKLYQEPSGLKPDKEDKEEEYEEETVPSTAESYLEDIDVALRDNNFEEFKQWAKDNKRGSTDIDIEGLEVLLGLKEPDFSPDDLTVSENLASHFLSVLKEEVQKLLGVTEAKGRKHKTVQELLAAIKDKRERIRKGIEEGDDPSIIQTNALALFNDLNALSKRKETLKSSSSKNSQDSKENDKEEDNVDNFESNVVTALTASGDHDNIERYIEFMKKAILESQKVKDWVKKQRNKSFADTLDQVAKDFEDIVNDYKGQILTKDNEGKITDELYNKFLSALPGGPSPNIRDDIETNFKKYVMIDMRDQNFEEVTDIGLFADMMYGNKKLYGSRSKNGKRLSDFIKNNLDSFQYDNNVLTGAKFDARDKEITIFYNDSLDGSKQQSTYSLSTEQAQVDIDNFMKQVEFKESSIYRYRKGFIKKLKQAFTKPPVNEQLQKKLKPIVEEVIRGKHG